MTEHLTISNTPPKHPGMNFALLRQEGIKHIERLAGKLWTDYNTHDPGITILEQLCYAITDLSYRLDFEMKDLLASSPGKDLLASSPGEDLLASSPGKDLLASSPGKDLLASSPGKDLLASSPGEERKRKQFYTAREILTVNPLTINDYRKLLIDIDGVKNAWLEPIKNSQPPIYHNSSRHTLTFQEDVNNQRVNLNGLYRVKLEKEKNIKEQDEASLIKKVKTKLQQHRNLCEDFAKVEILPIEEITINAEIEVEEDFDGNELIAKLYSGINNFISPQLQFFTLKEMLEQGKTPEEIFDGVPLENGFIDDQQINSFTKKKELYTSDLIRIILDIEGIKTVKTLRISSSKLSQSEEWVLSLDPDSTPQLKDVGRLINDKNITFYKGQIPGKSLQNKTTEDQNKKTEDQNKKTEDIPIPVGQYRELSDYESIQNDFPVTYGIGEIGLPGSASPQRKAQAKQLQAYLMFFDQLLANYFAQLEQAKNLLSFQTQDKTTDWPQNKKIDLPPFPGASDILKSGKDSLLEVLEEWNKIDNSRKSRFLNHLMAQYCEKFTDYSLLLYDSIQEKKLIDNKVTFLQNYPQISAGRSKAFNYRDKAFDPPDQNQKKDRIWDTDNVSGLKKRICCLLGIPYNEQKLDLSNESNKIEGFHIVEHILLRPRKSNDTPQNKSDDTAQKKSNDTDKNSIVLHLGHKISEFKRKIDENKSKIDENKKVTCISNTHGLAENDKIQIFHTRNYNGIYLVTNVKPDMFDIETQFIKSETGEWAEVNRPDVYSFQLSFVFPNWIGRFTEPNFRQLIENIITSEIPAHITPYYHWLDKPKMKDFERDYTHWLNTIMNQNSLPGDIKNTTNNLIKELEVLGNTEITIFNVIGKMAIRGETENDRDFVVS